MKVKTKVFTKKRQKKQSKGFITRKKVCRFCISEARHEPRHIDYKEIKMLEAFVTERGKIVSTRYSGNCARHQRKVAEEIKKARFLSLLPYIRV